MLRNRGSHKGDFWDEERSRPIGQATISSAQTITNNTETSVNWTLAGVGDRWGMFDIGGTNPERITAPMTGCYLISIDIQFASNSTGYRQVVAYKNGTNHIAGSTVPAATVVQYLNASNSVYLEKGEYMEVKVLQTSGGDLDISASRCRVSMIYMGARYAA